MKITPFLKLSGVFAAALILASPITALMGMSLVELTPANTNTWHMATTTVLLTISYTVWLKLAKPPFINTAKVGQLAVTFPIVGVPMIWAAYTYIPAVAENINLLIVFACWGWLIVLAMTILQSAIYTWMGQKPETSS